MKSSELVICKVCRQESELYYEDDIIVSQTYCACGKPELKPIDYDRLMKIVNEIKVKYYAKQRSSCGERKKLSGKNS
jgi:hypothetical protein